MIRSRRAFTLIELLIVVAIIAILAAIAVPNFLEAQTRSKVSRVKADMRTLSTALESYRIDNNSYTFNNNEAQNPDSIGSDDPVGRFNGFQQLTTPIAYIATIPRDPFGPSKFRDTDTGWRPDFLAMGTGRSGSRKASGARWSSGPHDGMPSDCYMLESDGPDNWDNTRDALSTGNFPWSGINPNTFTAEAVALPYDPTNGTKSGGEILRFGGDKPAGSVYSYLWGASL